MKLYLCSYFSGCNNRTLYYFANGENLYDTRVYTFKYNGSYHTNDDNIIFDNGDEVGDMTFEEMNEFVVKLINEGRVRETLDGWKLAREHLS